MIESPFPGWSAIQWRDIVAGAQTERRGGAGPVRGLLGGKDLTGRFFLCKVRIGHRSLTQTPEDSFQSLLHPRSCPLRPRGAIPNLRRRLRNRTSEPDGD